MRIIVRLLSIMLSTTFVLAGCTQLQTTPDDEPVTDEDIDPKADTDADGVPDLVELFTGTDPADAGDAPRTPRTSGACPTGWLKRDMLCVSGLYYRSKKYRSASLYCRGMEWYYKAPIRVANYEDLSYIYLSFPNLASSYNPNGRWIGNIVDDDRVLCGNKSITSSTDNDRYNFEGRCNKGDSKRFWCVMDLGIYDATH